MIFAPDMIPLISSRRKTQTRRPIKRHPVWKFEMGCKYRVGQRYRVQHTAEWTAARLRVHARICERQAPNRARAVLAYLDEPIRATWPKGRAVSTNLHITVIDVRRERLGEIDERDARKEGFRFVAQFEERWRRLYGNYQPEQEVWVITFTIGDERALFDADRLLRATPGVAGDDVEEHQDYTNQPALAMRGEPPAVPVAYQENLSTGARARDSVRKRAERAEKSRADRLRAIEDAADDGDQHAKRHLHVIDQRIQQAERKRAREAGEAA